MNIEVVIPARAWRYLGDKAKTTDTTGEAVFRLVGPAKDGSSILERDDGTLFRAVEL